MRRASTIPCAASSSRFGSDGRSLTDRVIPPTSTFAKVDDGSGAQVWLERTGGPGPRDEIVAERMAAAAGIILDRSFGSSSYAVDPGALELLLSPQVSDVDRARCARLLGFAHARIRRGLVCGDVQRDVITESLETVTSRIRAWAARWSSWPRSERSSPP